MEVVDLQTGRHTSKLATNSVTIKAKQVLLSSRPYTADRGEDREEVVDQPTARTATREMYTGFHAKIARFTRNVTLVYAVGVSTKAFTCSAKALAVSLLPARG
jgi:hypothetical protein